jgi:hypothetical protein
MATSTAHTTTGPVVGPGVQSAAGSDQRPLVSTRADIRYPLGDTSIHAGDSRYR